MRKQTAVFVASYCLRSDGFDLTSMSRAGTYRASRLAHAGEVDWIILSTAYECWDTEATLKKMLLRECGVDLSAVSVIPAVKDTYDEVNGTAIFIRKHCIEKLIVVAEERHLKRALLAFDGLKKELPELEIVGDSFPAPRFDRAHEPHPIKILGWVKSVRSGNKWLWIAWNKLFEFLTPLATRLKKS